MATTTEPQDGVSPAARADRLRGLHLGRRERQILVALPLPGAEYVAFATTHPNRSSREAVRRALRKLCRAGLVEHNGERRARGFRRSALGDAVTKVYAQELKNEARIRWPGHDKDLLVQTCISASYGLTRQLGHMHLKTGKTLIKWESQLPPQEFRGLLLQTPFSERHARKLMAIARCPVLAEVEDPWILPMDLEAVYQLSKIPNSLLKSLLEDGQIRPDLEEHQIRKGRFPPGESRFRPRFLHKTLS